MSVNQASLKWFCLDENKTCWFPGDMHQINSYDKHTLVYLFFVYSKSSSTAICSLASNFVDNGVVVNLSRSHDAAESFLLLIPTQRQSRKYFFNLGKFGWLIESGNFWVSRQNPPCFLYIAPSLPRRLEILSSLSFIFSQSSDSHLSSVGTKLPV